MFYQFFVRNGLEAIQYYQNEIARSCCTNDLQEKTVTFRASLDQITTCIILKYVKGLKTIYLAILGKYWLCEMPFISHDVALPICQVL